MKINNQLHVCNCMQQIHASVESKNRDTVPAKTAVHVHVYLDEDVHVDVHVLQCLVCIASDVATGYSIMVTQICN